MLGGWQLPVDGPPNAEPGACRYYAESGHSVCYAFLEFYDQYGGPAMFGYPISEFRLEGERIVQYFQGFRLDWHPEDDLAAGVRVAPLGRIHFDSAGYDSRLLRPALPSDIFLYRITELRPKASVLRPVVGSRDTQEVFLQVLDQNRNPVRGAAVTLWARFPGEERTLIMPATDDQGLSRLSLSFEGQPAGQTVLLEFWVVYGEFQALTQDSFLIWW